MSKKKVLVITDNRIIYERIMHYYKSRLLKEAIFEFRSSRGTVISKRYANLTPLILKRSWRRLIGKYDIIISAHSKQIFPKELVDQISCINIHPGYNPYNRGWYPQVFSIINKKITGATIHLMDDQLDHGPIIAREMVKQYSWDTSLSLYKRIQNLELKLFKSSIRDILSGSYKTFEPEIEGNINLKEDFLKMCEVKLEEKNTLRNFINQLRALSHGKFDNAYFYDKEGNKIFIKILLKRSKHD